MSYNFSASFIGPKLADARAVGHLIVSESNSIANLGKQKKASTAMVSFYLYTS